MTTFWQTFLGALGAGGVLVALLAFLGRSLLNQLMQKDLERFKSDLLHEASRRDIVFTRLHTQRADAIVDIYSALHSLANSSARLSLHLVVERVDVPQVLSEERLPAWLTEEVMKKIGQDTKLLNEAVDRSGLWLPITLEEKVQKYASMHAALSRLVDAKTSPNNQGVGKLLAGGRAEEWMARTRNFNAQEQALFRELREAFRDQLGVREFASPT